MYYWLDLTHLCKRMINHLDSELSVLGYNEKKILSIAFMIATSMGHYKCSPVTDNLRDSRTWCIKSILEDDYNTPHLSLENQTMDIFHSDYVIADYIMDEMVPEIRRLIELEFGDYYSARLWRTFWKTTKTNDIKVTVELYITYKD